MFSSSQELSIWIIKFFIFAKPRNNSLLTMIGLVGRKKNLDFKLTENNRSFQYMSGVWPSTDVYGISLRVLFYQKHCPSSWVHWNFQPKKKHCTFICVVCVWPKPSQQAKLSMNICHPLQYKTKQVSFHFVWSVKGYTLVMRIWTGKFSVVSDFLIFQYSIEKETTRVSRRF